MPSLVDIGVQTEKIAVAVMKKFAKDKDKGEGSATTKGELDALTSDEAPLSYWKDLAETRKKALEETLSENEELHKKLEELEKDNQELEEMVEHAKRLAELVSSITDDSGLGASFGPSDAEQSEADISVIASIPEEEESDKEEETEPQSHGHEEGSETK